MKKFQQLAILSCVAVVAASRVVSADSFNGQGDLGRDDKGYYYAISGGLFPTGTTPNGDNASGGTFRYLTDDPAWGTTIDVWHKDDWYPSNASIAVTLKNASTIVYDNNGLENGTFPANYYTYNAGTFPTSGAGAVTAYSMSNNWDWIYAGYLNLTQETTVTSLVGYFAYSGNPADGLTGPFDPNDPLIRYHMNIFSNVEGDLLPTNTGSFAGDIFSSDSTAGTFAWSDTGYDRTGSSSQQNIYRLEYTLSSSITLQPGVYWFSHDASIVPEPASLGALAIGAAGLLLVRRRKM